MLNKQLLLFNNNANSKDTPFYVDFGDSIGTVTIAENVIPTFYISYNGTEWSDQASGGDAIQVQSGRVYFKAVEPTNKLYTASLARNAWDISGVDVKLGGNINSLLSSDNPSQVAVGINAFASMFRGCQTIVDASELILSAKTTNNYSYEAMFKGCTALRTSPIICAEHVGAFAFNTMFTDCISLERITCLATDAWSANCRNWVQHVSPTGTFYKHRDATWQTGDSGIPNGWDVIDYN